MGGKRPVLAVSLVCLIGLAAVAAWNASRPSAAGICEACRRPVHARTRTTALVGDRKEQFCCPACALSAHRQSGKPVRLLDLTDYESAARLKPENAYLVKGSDVNPCAQQHLVPDEAMRVPAQHFDRCSPSILAFASPEAAEAFIAVHGGDLMPYQRLAAGYTR